MTKSKIRSVAALDGDGSKVRIAAHLLARWHILGVEGSDWMRLDRKALNRLLSLNDAQLAAVIDKLTRDYGIDLSSMNISTTDMAALRRTLQNTSDAELTELARRLRGDK